MTPEQKDLLLKDLCARLPYGVKIAVDNEVEILEGVSALDAYVEYDSLFSSDIEDIKPYLFPMSSMTEEQRVEALPLLNNCDYYDIEGTIKWLDNHPIKFFDWCNKNHFDYRNLIDKNLAIDCTNLNIY